MKLDNDTQQALTFLRQQKMIHYSLGKKCGICGIALPNGFKVLTCQRCRKQQHMQRIEEKLQLPQLGPSVRARFETPRFTFEAFAPTELEARCWLAAAWARHAKQSGADPNYLKEYESGIMIDQLPLRGVLLDNQPYSVDDPEK